MAREETQTRKAFLFLNFGLIIILVKNNNKIKCQSLKKGERSGLILSNSMQKVQFT